MIGSIRLDLATGRAGGWAVAPAARRSRVAFALVHALIAFAGSHHCSRVFCYATDRNDSAAMLLRLGGEPGMRFKSERYRCQMQTIQFRPEWLRSKKLREVFAGRGFEPSLVARLARNRRAS